MNLEEIHYTIQFIGFNCQIKGLKGREFENFINQIKCSNPSLQQLLLLQCLPQLQLNSIALNGLLRQVRKINMLRTRPTTLLITTLVVTSSSQIHFSYPNRTKPIQPIWRTRIKCFLLHSQRLKKRSQSLTPRYRAQRQHSLPQLLRPLQTKHKSP